MIETQLQSLISEIYPSDKIEDQLKRYKLLYQQFRSKFNSDEVHYFSVPGRSELSGNHTDHNHGKVLACSINLDSIAAASVNGSDIVNLYSSLYEEPFQVNLTNKGVIETEKGTTSALIRGIAAELNRNGFIVGGFDCFMMSDVLIGSGLSSSASIEVLIGSIFNALFNQQKIDTMTLAKAGQYAENNYMGKPCGLMDQVACAEGGIVTIDFKDPKNPLVRRIDFDINNYDYNLLVVDTGGNHADLTDDYASIPREMKMAAEYFSKSFCRDVDFKEFMENIAPMRKQISDRAILRAYHFFKENDRVDKQVAALDQKNLNKFLGLVTESGLSSFKYLQNIYSAKNISDQSMSLALALTEHFISEKAVGACRVHGGGFAGTILVFLPAQLVDEYRLWMEKVFGKDSVHTLNIRQRGAVYLGSNLIDK